MRTMQYRRGIPKQQNNNDKKYLKIWPRTCKGSRPFLLCVARRVRNRRRRRTELRGESRFWPRTRLSLVFAADKVDSMLFLAVIARIARPRESESNDLLALSRVGHAGLTVITLVYVLVILWRQ